MLIIEGPDGVGKSALQKAFIKMWNDNAKRYSPWPAVAQSFSRLPDSWHHYKSYLAFITRSAVMDRFHLSELCYGAVCRGGEKIGPSWLRLLEARLALAGSVTVVVTCSDDRASEQYLKQTHAGKQEMFSLEQVVAVNKAYRDWLVGGERESWKDARVDFHLSLPDDDSVWPSACEEWMDQVLREWSSRLSAVYSLDYNGLSFYGPPNVDCKSEGQQ